MDQHEFEDSRSPPSKQGNRTTLITFLALLFSALIITTRLFQPYLLAILTGAIFSNLSRRAFHALQKKGLGRKRSAFVVTLAIMFLVIGPFSLFVSLAVHESVSIAHSVSSDDHFSLSKIIGQLSHWGPAQSFIGDPAQFEAHLRSGIQTGAKQLASIALSLVGNVPKILLQFALSLISCFFFHLDGRRLLHWATDKIPMDHEVRSNLIQSFKNTSASVIWATLAAASAQASIMLIGYLVLRVPASWLAAGATFILAWIPMVGSTPVWVAGSVYLLVHGTPWAAAAMLGFGIVTATVDNFIRPAILKGRADIHPLVSLIAIFGGIQMFGIVGVFLGPILTSITLSLLEVWPRVGERYGILSERASSEVEAKKRIAS